MNNRGQKSVLGFALLLAAFVFIIVAFVTIEPFKETLDTARNSSSLNCQGTDGFNQTAFDNDNSNPLNKLTRRPTCFITGISMVWFVGVIFISVFIWLVKNWSKIGK